MEFEHHVVTLARRCPAAQKAKKKKDSGYEIGYTTVFNVVTQRSDDTKNGCVAD